MFISGSDSSRISRARLSAQLTWAGLVVSLLTSCSSAFRSTTSLSPVVQTDTLGYNDAVGDASDAILLSNILRSRDFAPLNLNQLSSLSGALSLQGTLGLSFPLGPPGSMGSGTLRAQTTATPSVMASTSPTYSLTPLNTQAFTLNILQPVTASYVLNRWQAGIPRELLLMLFVKEVDFPVAPPPGAKPKNKFSGTIRYINNPDNDGQFSAYRNLVDALIEAHAELKAVDVLDPVGPAFTLYAAPAPPAATSNPTPKPSGTDAKTPDTTAVVAARPDLKNPINADATGFGLVTNNNDGQYHLGNEFIDAQGNVVPPVKGQKVATYLNGGQMYRVYAGQVELCVDARILKKLHYAVPDLLAPDDPGSGPVTQETDTKTSSTASLDATAAAEVVAELKLEAQQAYQGNAIRMDAVSSVFAAGASPGTQTPSASGGAAKAASGAASPQATSSSAALTAALQAGRVSAVVGSAGSIPDELVLPPSSEEGFQKESQGFVHVQWRSVSEIFDYLGAILRYNERTQTFQFPISRDPTVASEAYGACERYKDTTAGSCAVMPGDPPSAVLFAVNKDGAGHLSTSYNGDTFTVRDANLTKKEADYTKPVLSMLSTLVNYSSQSGSVSTSTPLRLLPIP
jgi:hypothetical protein